MNEQWELENLDDPEHRRGHVEANDKFIEWLYGGCDGRIWSVYECCRYGKSDTIRNYTVLAIRSKQASAGLVIHPSLPLSKQFLEKTRLLNWRKRWLAKGPRINNVQVLSDFAAQSMCHGEWLGSIHIQALMQPMQNALLLHWVEWCKTEYGCPPIVFFDEAHQFSHGNKWGSIARGLHSAGCIVVVLTATPFRNDGDEIFGFRKKPITEIESRKLTYVQPHRLDDSKIEIHTITKDEQEFQVEADVEIPFSQGWEEGVIAKITFDLIDGNTEGYGNFEGHNPLLSELPKDKARVVLPSLYRDPKVIAEAAERAIKHLRKFRIHLPDATCVWYGMNDESDSGISSENQKAIKKAIEKSDPSMKVSVATLAADAETISKDAEKSADIIGKFCDPIKKSSDFLILKQMGAAGLDSDRICVVVLWNTTRTLNQMIQMAMRGGNVAKKNHFFVIGLKDAITTERLAEFVADQGGQYKESSETDHEVEIVDRKERPDEGYVLVDVAEAGVSDSDGLTATFEEVQLANQILLKWPFLVTNETIPQIAAKAKELGVKAAVQPAAGEFVDTTSEVNLHRDNLTEWVQKIVRRMFENKHGRKAGKDDGTEWGELKRSVQAAIKARANVFGTWDKSSKDRSQNVSDYQKWTAAAQRLYEEACSEKNS